MYKMINVLSVNVGYGKMLEYETRYATTDKT